jgi:hypothetical protein
VESKLHLSTTHRNQPWWVSRANMKTDDDATRKEYQVVFMYLIRAFLRKLQEALMVKENRKCVY